MFEVSKTAQAPPSSFEAKKQRYRLEIRRGQHHASFAETRRQLLDSLHCQGFHELLEHLKKVEDSPHPQQVQRLISALAVAGNEADFNIKFAYQKLECVLFKILYTQGGLLKINDKISLIDSLVHLTYYCNSSSANIATEKLVDYFRDELRKIELQTLDQLTYLNKIVCLAMNLASLFVSEFNLYIAESDFSLLLNKLISKSINIVKRHDDPAFLSGTYALRQNTLRFYRNVLNKDTSKLNINLQLIETIFADKEYSDRHQISLLSLLTEAVKIQQFWEAMSRRSSFTSFVGDVSEMFDHIQRRCISKQYLQGDCGQLSNYEVKGFNQAICFLNEMSKAGLEDHWFELVTLLLNGYMLADFTFQVLAKNQQEELANALCLFSDLSSSKGINVEELLITRENVAPRQLLKVFANHKLLTSSRTSFYCLNILRNILSKEPSMLGLLMEFRLIECIQDLLQTNILAQITAAVLDLVAQLVTSEKDAEVTRLIRHKNIIHQIEKLQDAETRRVSRKAENLMSLIEQRGKL